MVIALMKYLSPVKGCITLYKSVVVRTLRATQSVMLQTYVPRRLVLPCLECLPLNQVRSRAHHHHHHPNHHRNLHLNLALHPSHQHLHQPALRLVVDHLCILLLVIGLRLSRAQRQAVKSLQKIHLHPSRHRLHRLVLCPVASHLPILLLVIGHLLRRHLSQVLHLVQKSLQRTH